MTAMTDNHDNPMDNAEQIIERFGGIRPMASKMDVPVTTVQGWKKRNVIPGNRREQVMEAAQSNNIDLSDLIAGVANENTFSREMEDARMRSGNEEEKRHQEAVLMAQKRTAAANESRTINDEMLAQMRRAQSMTFTKSVWFTIAFVTLVVIGAAVMLWPSKEKIERNGRQIAVLQGEVAEIRKPGFFKQLIPGDIEERIGRVQRQARDIQTTVGTLSTRVEEIANDVVLDKKADIATRIERLEQHASELGAPAQLTGMLHKIQGLQQSIAGQEQLSSAMADLNRLIGSMQAQGGDIGAALMQAQQEDDALGQTLQGVAPQDLKAAAMLLGLSQFRSSLNRSAPFEEDLALMQKMLGENDPQLQAAITKLAPKAASGVLTPDGLKGEFKGLAGDIVVSSLKGEDVSIQEKAKARFNDLLSVEKDGELITGTDTQAKVARAQKMLDAGDVEGAIAELQGLEGEAAVTARPFIDEAQMTLLAEQLQGMFASRVVNKMGGLGITAKGAQGAGQLINEIKKMTNQRHVIGDPAGFVILEPKQKLAP